MRGYRFGVEWIALNDDAGSSASLEPERVAGYISTALLADLFDKSTDDVAADIVRKRRHLAEREAKGG